MTDTCLSCNGFGRCLVVAGEHDHIQFCLVHGLYCLNRIRLQYVRSGNGSQIPPFFVSEVQWCFPLPHQLRKRRNRDAQLLHPFTVSTETACTPNHTGYTFSRYRFKIPDLGDRSPLQFVQDGFGKGMFRTAFQRTSGQKQFFFGKYAWEYIRHLWLSCGQGPSFVQNNRIHPVQIFQCLSIFEENPHLGAPAGSNHDGDRCGQAQSTGAGNHQNRNGAGQAEFQTLPQNHPDHKRDGSNAHDHRHEDTGNPICQSGNGRFGAASLLNHPDHLSQGGVLPYLFRPEFQVPLCIDGRRCHRVPRGFLHRDTFSGQSALIHSASAFHHSAIYGDTPSGADNDNISHLDLIHGNLLNLPFPANHSSFWAQIHQCPDGIPCTAFCSGFQKFTQRNEGQDHCRRLKIKIFAIALYQFPILMAHSPCHAEQGCHTIDQSCQGTHRNQGIHIGSTVP